MKKTIILKKKLIDFAIKAMVVIAICSVVTWLAIDYYSTQENELQNAESEITNNVNEIAKIQDAVNIYEKSFTWFVKIQKEIDNNKYELNADRGSKILELLGRKHRIRNLTAEITAKKKIGTLEYDGYNPISRTVSLKFAAMSDAHIYAFLRNIDKYFSGNIEFNKINITQKREIDYNVLKETKKGVTLELLEAEINFTWLGIEQKAEEKPIKTQDKI
jgi:hypothetical protein